MMLEQIVNEFLTLRLEKGSNLLLGLSGGPDSMALLYLLVEAKKTLDFSLHIAHVDHGWREESAKEAKVLKEVAHHFSVPFYTRRLGKMDPKDLENQCRKERIKFFSELKNKHNYQAVLLGHHAGDQAETVFKRIAEGSSLEGLGGIYPDRMLEDLRIWRPLIEVSKDEIYGYLQRKKIHFFEDVTNQDPKYLRSRMRQDLFPTLEKIFGKKLEGNFERLGKLSQELTGYFNDRSVEIEKKLVKGPFGMYLELEGIHQVELRFFLRKLAPFSHDALEVLLKLIRQRRSSRKILVGSVTFQLSRSHLFIFDQPFPDFFEDQNLWSQGESGDWKEFWQGRVKISQGATLKKLSDLEPILKRKLKKWYGSKRVPAFFYDKAPVLTKDGKIVGDSLTGQKIDPKKF